jgi:N-6 DNA Methylase
MQTGQGSFWNYDFSCIPVELLSGIYESFLTPDQQAKDGAYYTPRNLAMLAVDQAFAGSADPLQETIFDGACGSGILLTTAYRRLIAHAEVKQGRQLGFAERGELLKRRIFGGDINFMACRVTAFSLYLSLLEGLSPADILEAQERDGTKLPSLNGTNLCHGNEADFFLDSHRFAGRLFSLFISNPPWTEPEGATVTTADAWAVRARAPFVRRQIAGAFALRAADFLRQGGRACLILPIGQLLAPSSESFVSHLLHLYRPEQLVNFGDLQALLFPTAENTCHVFVGSRREPADAGAVPFGETFDYCVPKADISLAQGRLTMQSADRHVLQTTSVIRDPSVLVTLMWGDAQDLSIWTRLAARGTFADFWSGPKDQRRWITRKGIHRVDKSRTSVSAEPLERLPYVDVAALKAGSPVFHPELLRPWPAEQYTVVGLSKEVLRVFDGPRVLFPDGFSKEELNIRAVYIDKPASFTHSVGVIAGPVEDAALLKFTAVYLRSSLARYFLMMRGWKMLCERNGVHLSDVESFPFFEPSKAPDPDKARHSIASVVEHLEVLAGADELERQRHYEDAKGTLDEAVFDYFGLSEQERHLILETVDVLMPSIRPRSFKSLNTPAQVRASATEVGAYATTLGNGLTSWRNRMNGEGQFLVSVATAHPEKPGASGIVRVAFRTGRAKEAVTDVQISDQIVLETMKQLRLAGLQTVRSGDSLELLPDAHIWTDGLLYLVRPLTRRSWTTRQALRDAEQIVRLVQANSMRPKAKEAA